MAFEEKEKIVHLVLKCVTHKEEETIQVGTKLGKILVPGDIVLISGELGAGKTVLVKGIAHGMGIDDKIKSPTFTIAKVYDERLYHIDIYRIQADSFFDIEDYFLYNGVVVVEWGEALQGSIHNRSYLFIRISYLSMFDRQIEIFVCCHKNECELLHRLRSGLSD